MQDKVSINKRTVLKGPFGISGSNWTMIVSGGKVEFVLTGLSSSAAWKTIIRHTKEMSLKSA